MRYEKVLCTGGSGRLGQYVVARLKGLCRLTVADLRPAGDDVAFRQVDVADYAALRDAVAGHDAVVHLAAIPNPRTSTPETCFRINVIGAWGVLQAAEEAGVRRVVVASSDAVLGMHYNPPDWGPLYLPIDEAHPLRPSEVYSLSKQVTETICQSFAHRGRPEIIVIRPTHIVFPPEYPELEARGADVHNYHLWTYVSPEDMAEAFRLALERQSGGFSTYAISAADGLNTRPTLEMLRERFGRLPEIRKPEHFERLPTASILDITRAREELGFEPQSDWRRMAATAGA